jgi:hypothetical protein
MESALGHAAAFAAVATPSVFLDPHLIIRGANPAYLRAVRRPLEELEGRQLFAAFPENPADREGGGKAAVEACLRNVLAGKGAEHLPLLRYDIALPDAPAHFAERHWSVIGSPIADVEGELAGVLLQAHDVTAFRRRLVRVLRELDDTVVPGEEADGEPPVGADAVAVTVVAGLHRQLELREENAQLQQALTSRAVIDQAIGITLAEHAGTPEDAFRRLVTVSQGSNVKLRDVARALVARAAEPERPLVP